MKKLTKTILVSSLALVGSGSADYLWILSRTPSLDGDAKVAILDEIHRRYSESERVAKARQITERNHAKSPNENASNHRMRLTCAFRK